MPFNQKRHPFGCLRTFIVGNYSADETEEVLLEASDDVCEDIDDEEEVEEEEAEEAEEEDAGISRAGNRKTRLSILCSDSRTRRLVFSTRRSILCSIFCITRGLICSRRQWARSGPVIPAQFSLMAFTLLLAAVRCMSTRFLPSARRQLPRSMPVFSAQGFMLVAELEESEEAEETEEDELLEEELLLLSSANAGRADSSRPRLTMTDAVFFMVKKGKRKRPAQRSMDGGTATCFPHVFL